MIWIATVSTLTVSKQGFSYGQLQPEYRRTKHIYTHRSTSTRGMTKALIKNTYCAFTSPEMQSVVPPHSIQPIWFHAQPLSHSIIHKLSTYRLQIWTAAGTAARQVIDDGSAARYPAISGRLWYRRWYGKMSSSRGFLFPAIYSPYRCFRDTLTFEPACDRSTDSNRFIEQPIDWLVATSRHSTVINI